ncbi:MAG: hypothetical protein ACJ8EM_09815 [Sphingomicrobium sp.]
MSERAKQLLKSDLMKDILAGLEKCTTEDWDYGEKIGAVIIEVLRNSNEGPWTLLVPTQEALDKYFPGHEEAPESSSNATIGLFLDLYIQGTMLADGIDEAMAAGNGAVEMLTLGGCVVTARRQEGKLVLINPSGGRTTLIGPPMRSPRGDALFKVDNFLNGEFWASYLKSGGAADN